MMIKETKNIHEYPLKSIALLNKSGQPSRVATWNKVSIANPIFPQLFGSKSAKNVTPATPKI